MRFHNTRRAPNHYMKPSRSAKRHSNRRRDAFCCHITSCGLVCKSCIREGSLPHFDLSIMSADLEAWLRVYGWAVNDMAIFKIKPGSVIRTLNAVVHQLPVRKRPTKMRTRVGHRKEVSRATDEKNWYALNHRLGWFVIGSL